MLKPPQSPYLENKMCGAGWGAPSTAACRRFCRGQTSTPSVDRSLCPGRSLVAMCCGLQPLQHLGGDDKWCDGCDSYAALWLLAWSMADTFPPDPHFLEGNSVLLLLAALRTFRTFVPLDLVKHFDDGVDVQIFFGAQVFNNLCWRAKRLKGFEETMSRSKDYEDLL